MNDVLFIRLRLLGDIIFTIPALQLFKNRYPKTRIHYLVEQRFRELAELIPLIDRVITVPEKLGLTELHRFRRQVRSQKIRTVVDFHSGPTSALLTLTSGAEMRIGYRTPNRNWAYNHLVPRKVEGSLTHSVVNQARLLEILGIDANDPPAYPLIPVSTSGISPDVAQLVDGPPFVILHVGAGNRFRYWGVNHFAQLGRRLIDQRLRLVLVGNTEEERRKGGELTKRLPCVNLTGRLSLREMHFIISRALVFVGADSGPLHLASLTATPLVALYGPNLPQISGPWRRENVQIIQRELSCRPCSQRRCIYDTIRCMKEISVDKVHEAVARQIR